VPVNVRPVRLPDAFYLPRTTWDGLEIRDVMPWQGATAYVTDGERYGIRFEDGRIRWLGDAWKSQVELFREDFAGVDLEALVEGLRGYVRQHQELRALWREDMEALEILLNERETAPDE
jgi:hypothetical protein